MRIFRCGIVDYPEGQIYSIDVHPSGNYIATCGNDGRGNGLVTIWSTLSFNLPSASTKPEINNSINSNATSSVSLPASPSDVSFTNIAKYKLEEKALFNKSQNCVRWSRSNEGRWLVAAGDCPTLYLYEPFYQRKRGDVSLENAITLNGHSLEILHADFSYDGKFLASCSLDNTVIIWNLEDLPNALIVLNSNRGGHNDFVTGLAWDPAEKFLATQSADNTLKIWRCETWECERTIKGLFANGSRSSLFARLDWSTDGAFLIAACAVNSGFQTAKVIIRKGFSQELDFVGFRNVVSCVRSNDRCVLYQDPKHGEMKLSLIAVGSLDRSVSLWLLPNVNRPLCVIRNLFPEGILDFSWHKNMLAVVGINGSIRCIFLDDSEIGRFLSGSEMCSHFDGLYGNIPTSLKTYLPKLNVDGSASLIEQIMQDLYIPSEHLTARCIRNHACLGYHVFTLSCDKCRQLYSRLKEDFNGSSLQNLAQDLQQEIQGMSIKDLEENTDSSSSEWLN